jgi:hypothetical protein
MTLTKKKTQDRKEKEEKGKRISKAKETMLLVRRNESIKRVTKRSR